MTLVVGQGVGGGEQGGDDEGEADNWSRECLVKRMKPVMFLRDGSSRKLCTYLLY